MASKKPKISESTTNRRNPTQSRSREKVEKILLAVKFLIEKDGVANLKIGAIAQKAGVSPSSIYQYFSDKETIIIALAEHYMVQISEIIANNISEMKHTQLSRLIRKNFVDIYQLHVKEPALRAIWFESVDPRLNQLAFDDTQKNVEMIMNEVTKYISEDQVETCSEFVLLASHQFAATLRLGIAFGEEKGQHFVDMHANMISNSIEQYIGAESLDKL